MAINVNGVGLPDLPSAVTALGYWVIVGNKTAGGTSYACYAADAPFYSDGTQIAANSTKYVIATCLVSEDGTVPDSWTVGTVTEGTYYNGGAAPIMRCANHDVKTAVITDNVIASTTEEVFYAKNYPPVKYFKIKSTTLTGIADAIREKTGGTEEIPVPEMEAQIRGITGGGGETIPSAEGVEF